jgi:hypothetical protein
VTSDQEQREAAPVPGDPAERSGWAYPPFPPYDPRSAPPYAPPPMRPPAPPRHRRRAHPALAGLLIVTVLLSGIVFLTPGDNLKILRHLTGLDFADSGSYEFMQTQPGTGDPVGYNPCQTIRVTVNPAGAPDNFAKLVDTAMQHTSEATGLRFLRVSNTDDREFGTRDPNLPVLVAWANALEDPDLAGDIVGVGGSIPVRRNGRLEYATGVVVLDSNDFAAYGPRDRALEQAVLDHEFGHLVGLDHVHDSGELMNEENLGQTTYGPGDLEGLRRIGEIGC